MFKSHRELVQAKRVHSYSPSNSPRRGGGTGTPPNSYTSPSVATPMTPPSVTSPACNSVTPQEAGHSPPPREYGVGTPTNRSQKELAQAKKRYTLSMSPRREGHLQYAKVSNAPQAWNEEQRGASPSSPVVRNAIRDPLEITSNKELAKMRRWHMLSVSPDRENLRNLRETTLGPTGVPTLNEQNPTPKANHNNTVTILDAANVVSNKELRHAKRQHSLSMSPSRQASSGFSSHTRLIYNKEKHDSIIVKVQHPCEAEKGTVPNDPHNREWKYHPQKHCSTAEKVAENFSSNECLHHEKMSAHAVNIPSEKESPAGHYWLNYRPPPEHDPTQPKHVSNKRLKILKGYHATALYPTEGGSPPSSLTPQQQRTEAMRRSRSAETPSSNVTYCGVNTLLNPERHWEREEVKDERTSQIVLQHQKQRCRRSFSTGGSVMRNSSVRRTFGRRYDDSPTELYTSQAGLQFDKNLSDGTVLVGSAPSRRSVHRSRSASPCNARCHADPHLDHDQPDPHTSNALFSSKKQHHCVAMHGGSRLQKQFAGYNSVRRTPASPLADAGHAAGMSFGGNEKVKRDPLDTPCIYGDDVQYGQEGETRVLFEGEGSVSQSRGRGKGEEGLHSSQRRLAREIRGHCELERTLNPKVPTHPAGRTTDTTTPDIKAQTLKPTTTPKKTPKTPLRVPVGHSIVPVSPPAPAYVGIRWPH